MEIPSWVCEKIFQMDPNCRLGYSGKFAVVKLFRARDAERFMYAPDEWRSRGPIYNRHGKASPDWDLLSRVPCKLADVSATAIYDGEILRMMKEWTSDFRDIKRENLLRLASEDEAKLDDLSNKMADYAQWHHRYATKVGEEGSTPIVARKFLNKHVEARIHGDVERKNRYREELETLETQWRKTGWVPKEER